MLVASVIAVVSGSVGYYLGQRPSENTQKIEEENQIKEPPVAPPVPTFTSKKSYLISEKLDDVVFKKDLLEEIMSIKLRKTVVDDVQKADLLGEIKSVQLRKRATDEEKKTSYSSENIFLKQLNEKRQSLRKINVDNKLNGDTESILVTDNILINNSQDISQDKLEDELEDKLEDELEDELEYVQTISEYVFLNE